MYYTKEGAKRTGKGLGKVAAGVGYIVVIGIYYIIRAAEDNS